MTYSKPLVTIELSEYQELLKLKDIALNRNINKLLVRDKDLVFRTRQGETILGSLNLDAFRGVDKDSYDFFVRKVDPEKDIPIGEIPVKIQVQEGPSGAMLRLGFQFGKEQIILESVISSQYVYAFKNCEIAIRHTGR